jgi:hypothetical protein
MSWLLERWRRHWFDPAPLADLAIARLVLVAVIVVLDGSGRAAFVADAPPQFYEPIPFLTAIGLPHQPARAVVDLVARVETGALVLVAIGLCARPALLGVFVLQTIQEAWTNSLGKVTHATLPLLYALLFLALSPCDRVLSVRALVRGRPEERCSPDARWPIELAFVALAGYYAKAGVAKLLDGGIAWADGATLQHYLLGNGSDAAMWLAASPGLCRILSTLVLTFELGAPLGIARPLRPFVLAGGACFHLGTAHFLGISFWPVVAVYPIFVPWTRLATAVRGALDTGRGSRH